MAGAEVVQIYVKPLAPSVKRHVHELKNFEKVHLKPGETRVLQFLLNKQAFSFYDVMKGGWKVDSGNYEIQVGTSSRNLELSSAILIP